MTSENPITWKTYLTTGAKATLAIASTHLLASLTKSSCANNWTTIGIAGAIGSLVGAYEHQHGSLFKKILHKKHHNE